MGTVPANPRAARTAEDEAVDRDGWQVSPLVPAIGVGLLALLWVFSALDGWAAAAFCSDRGLGNTCSAHVVAAVRPSIIPAIIATALAVVALLAPLVKPSAARARLRLLVISAACWVLALAIVFVAGQAAAG